MLPKEFSEAATRTSKELFGDEAQPEVLLDGRISGGEQFRVYRGRVNGLGRFLVVATATSHLGGELMTEEIFTGSSSQVRHPSRTEQGRGGWLITSYVMGAETRIAFPPEYSQDGKILINRQELLPSFEIIEGEGLPDPRNDLPGSPDSEQLSAVQ
ncbi:MAG TPA: hypothetical protein VLA92_04790 [Candidatus Saccharimonadales bacterium]|nr:hypothetical protein [Candidatus Saccharimonadales bacterium]